MIKTARTSLVLGAVLLAGVIAFCQPATEKTETFHLNLTTAVEMAMKMPGMAGMPHLPGMPNTGATPGQPTHTVAGTASYPQQAVEPIFVSVPPDLKLPDNKLVLHVPQPVTGVAGGQAGAPAGAPQGGKMQMSIKLYWHPDEAKGPITQDISIDTSKGHMGMPGMGGMSMEQIEKQMEKMHLANSAQGSTSELPQEVIGAGDYVLNTGGTATLQGFLPPVHLVQPADLAAINKTAPIKVQWDPVKDARGYLVKAMGMTFGGGGKMTITSWYSTLIEPPMRVRYGYQQATTIADDLAKGILLPGNTTSVTVPGGIFNDVMMLHLTVEAVGPDFYSKENGTTVIGTIRSTWTGGAMLGMGMGMGGG